MKGLFSFALPVFLVLVLHVPDGSAQETLEHTDWINAVEFSPDGTLLASASDDGTVKIWEVATGTLVATLEHTGSVESVAFSPDGTLLASVPTWTVELWDVEKREHIATLEGHTSFISEVAFSPDGTLASGSWDDTIKLWDVTTQENIATLEETDAVFSLAFSSDGSLLASGLNGGPVNLWDVAAREHTAALEGHTDDIKSVSFSSKGVLASGSDDGTVILWDAAKREASATLELDAVYSVSFSPDGTLVAATGFDPTLWEVGTGTFIAALEGGDINATAVAFSPDGSLLASGSFGIVRLWDVSPWTSPVATAAIERESIDLPDTPELHQNYPNPFNSQTRIAYSLVSPGSVHLEVFDLTGQRVAVLYRGSQAPGFHRLRWDGRDESGHPLASGIYFYRLVTAEGLLTRKLTLLR